MSEITWLASCGRPRKAISLRMMKPICARPTPPQSALRQEPYTSKTLFSFFDGLIPEGWLLDLVTHNWKLRANDRLGLLLVACKDCIGSVVIREVTE